MTTPDAAAALLYTDRARHALNLSRQYLAQANAVLEQDDPDDLHAAVRRGVYRHLTECADLYERYADDCRERAFSAQQIRRQRYDTVPNTVTKPGVTVADDVARRNAS